MKVQFAVCRYSGKTRQELSVHETEIQADDALRKLGEPYENVRVVKQMLREDGTVCYEKTIGPFPF